MCVSLLFMLQLESFMVLPQCVVLFGETDVSCLQLLQQPLALTEPAQNNLLHIFKTLYDSKPAPPNCHTPLSAHSSGLSLTP